MSSRNLKLAIPLAAALFVVAGISGVATANFAPAAVQQDGLPSGAVMFFNADSCPAGWLELEDARGRYLVGVTDVAFRGTTVGTPLGDEEERSVGRHSHVLTDAGHTHTLTDPGHGHVGEALKAHAIDRIWQDFHSHTTAAAEGGGDGEKIDHTDATDDPKNLETSSASPTIHWLEGPDGEGHSHDIDISSNTTGMAIAENTTGIELAEAGIVDGTNAPYLELLVCVKP